MTINQAQRVVKLNDAELYEAVTNFINRDPRVKSRLTVKEFDIKWDGENETKYNFTCSEEQPPTFIAP